MTMIVKIVNDDGEDADDEAAMTTLLAMTIIMRTRMRTRGECETVKSSE